MKTLKELQKEVNDWQDSIFTKATPLSAVIHLQKEIKELKFEIEFGSQKIKMKEELADCQILLMGVAHLLGVDLEEVTEDKMVINRRREWGDPDKDGVVEHIKDSSHILQSDKVFLLNADEEIIGGTTEALEEVEEAWKKVGYYMRLDDNKNSDDLFHSSYRQGE